MSTKARNNQQVREAYLWLINKLREIKAEQHYLFPPTALEDELHPKSLVLWSNGKRVGLSTRGERVLRSWSRKGLHTRWGMHRQRYPELYHNSNVRRFLNDEWRGYTTHADFQQQQINLSNFMTAVNLALEDGKYPLEDGGWDDLNQNDAHVG